MKPTWARRAKHGGAGRKSTEDCQSQIHGYAVGCFAWANVGKESKTLGLELNDKGLGFGGINGRPWSWDAKLGMCGPWLSLLPNQTGRRPPQDFCPALPFRRGGGEGARGWGAATVDERSAQRLPSARQDGEESKVLSPLPGLHIHSSCSRA